MGRRFGGRNRTETVLRRFEENHGLHPRGGVLLLRGTDRACGHGLRGMRCRATGSGRSAGRQRQALRRDACPASQPWGPRREDIGWTRACQRAQGSGRCGPVRSSADVWPPRDARAQRRGAGQACFRVHKRARSGGKGPHPAEPKTVRATGAHPKLAASSRTAHNPGPSGTG